MAGPSSFRDCDQNVHGFALRRTCCAQALRIRRQVIRGEMRIGRTISADSHPPSSCNEEWRAVLHMPARPGVPQIVPAKIADVGTFQCCAPGLGADLDDRTALVATSWRASNP